MCFINLLTLMKYFLCLGSAGTGRPWYLTTPTTHCVCLLRLLLLGALIPQGVSFHQGSCEHFFI
jgi:hypothetical protein